MSCSCPTCGASLPSDLLAIDRDAGIVVGAGRFTHLTAQEFAIFIMLYDGKGRVFSKESLHRAVTKLWGEESELKIVDVFVCKLRAKLKGMPIAIETAWGRGYRLLSKQPLEQAS